MRILQSMVALFGAFVFACGSSGGGSGGATASGGSGGADETSGSTTSGGTTSVVATTTSSGPPLTPFTCGTVTCEGTEFCEAVLPGTNTGGASAQPHYTCLPLPSTCSAVPTCDCVKMSPPSSCSFNLCMDDGAGHVTLTCPQA